MLIIYAIIGIVAALSLYEFIAGRHWQHVTSSYRNELVFEHRNKEYGAYQIRKSYDKRMVIIMTSFILVIGIVYGTYMIVKNMPEPPVKEEPMDLTQFTIAPTQEEEETPPPPPEEEIPPAEKTIAFIPPVVVDEEVETTPPIQDNLADTKTGTEDVEGNDNFDFHEETDKGPSQTEEKAPEILTFVEEVAEYPGGRAEMLKFLAENIKYPQIAIENELSGKCHLKFVVSPDGSISQVTILRGVPDCPECDKEAVRVVRSMPRWKPGKNGGKAVYSYFTLPVNFTLQ